MTATATVVFVILLGVAGFLRAAGASLIRTPRADALHDAAEGYPRADRIARLLEDPSSIAPSVNVMHVVLLVLASIVGTWSATAVAAGPALVVWLVALAVIVVFVGDLIPRSLGRSRSRRLAYRFASLLEKAVAMGSMAVNLGTEDGSEIDEVDPFVDEDDSEEIELISSVLEFSETLVREVMVPRTDMVVVDRDSDVDSLLAVVTQYGFSRIPVAGEGIDDIVGVVIVKDLLQVLSSGQVDATAETIIRPVDFVPETKRVPDLLKEMQASKSHMAVVVDEYGGTAGLVTIEDLLEELVGEIVDEFDDDELLVSIHGDGSWLVDGRLSVSDLAELAEIELPDEEWDTVGGLVLGLAGRVPHQGEKFEIAGLTVEVTRVQGRRVGQVVVRREVRAGDSEAS